MTLRLLVLMFLRGSIYGSIGPFATLLVIRGGMSPALVGPLAAGGAVATLLCAPAWGRLGDRHGRRRILVVAFLAAAPAAAAQATGSLALLVLGYLGWAVASSAFVPLADSLVLARVGGSRSRFARVRVGASSGYIVLALAAGALISFTAAGWAAPGLVGTVLCLLAATTVAGRLRGELRSGTGVAAAEGPGLLEGVRSGVGRHRWFLAGLVLVFAGANAPSIFTGPRVVEIGGSGWEVGLATAAGTVVELPAFMVLPWMLTWLGSRRLFVLGGVLLGVSGVLAAVAPTPLLLVAARLLFGAGYAWMVIPSLGAILSAAPPTEQAASAALHFAASAAGSLVVALAGLPLVGLTGSVSGVLAAAAIASPVGAVIALRAWPRATSTLQATTILQATTAAGTADVEGAGPTPGP